MPQRDFVAGALFFLFAQDAIRKRGAEYDATQAQAQALPPVFVAPAILADSFSAVRAKTQIRQDAGATSGIH